MKAYRARWPFRSLSAGWILLLALGVGGVYLFLLPPWQQNDEPSQFEYVWLAAHLDHWPRPGDYDLQMRREVASSMIEHGFYRSGGKPPNLISQSIDIGVPQLRGLPLYYFLASLPLRLFPFSDVTSQLYLARLVSLLLFLATVFFSFKASQLLFENPQLSTLLTLFVALLPQLAYRMTAVNDDTAAVATMTFFIWMSIRGIKGGADWKTWLGIPLGVGLCLLAKQTAWLALPFGILAVFLSVFHRHQGRIWIAALLILGATLLFAFEWKATIPAYFYQQGKFPQRIASAAAPDGKYVFLSNKQYNNFYQVLDRTILSQHSGKRVTAGAWVWANQPVDVPFLKLQIDGKDLLQATKITLTTQPAFFAAIAEIPEDFNIAVLRVITAGLSDEMEIYWDCLILIPGEQPLNNIPQVHDGCKNVEWDGYSGQNLVRNPSAEAGRFPLWDGITRAISSKFPSQATDLWGILDPPASSAYFRQAIEYMFRTFWGRFNQGTLPLAGNKPYRLFVVLTALAISGNVFALIRHRTGVHWNLLLYLFLLMVSGFFYTLFRFAGDWYSYNHLLPQARYFFPYILPTAFFICTGWFAWGDVILRSPKAKSWSTLAFLVILLGYNTWAWYTIWRYWYN